MAARARRRTGHRLAPRVVRGVADEDGVVEDEVLPEQGAAVAAGCVAREGDVGVVVAVAHDGAAVGGGAVPVERAVADGAGRYAVEIQAAAVIAAVGHQTRPIDRDRAAAGGVPRGADAQPRAAAQTGTPAAVGLDDVALEHVALDD